VEGRKVNKKLIFGLRVILYSVAAFVVYDSFFATAKNAAPAQVSLQTFTKKSDVIYYEYFFKKNEKDSVWYALQTMPSLGRNITGNKEGPWHRNDAFFKRFEDLGFEFVAFYLTPSLPLDAASFLRIRENLDGLSAHADARLRALNKNREFTAIFIKR
jgi:hypothetical protein